MSRSVVHTTPWSRSALKAMGWTDTDVAALAQRLPESTHLHISAKGPRGPFYVRLYIDGREVSPLDDYGSVPSYRDLGHAIEYVLTFGGVKA